MIYIKNTDIRQNENTIVTIGNFDGFHLGHLKLIEVVNKYKNKLGLKSIIFSFFPHPKNVLYNKNIEYIFTEEEKIYLLKKINIDIFIEYNFTKEFSLLSPEDFVKNILIKKLKCKALVVGEDYKFGKNCSGNIEILKNICKELKIKLITIKCVLYKDRKISSSNIRKLILKGNIKKANKMLYNNYFIDGIVVKGNQLGRLIGFPTVNLVQPSKKIIPINGVYITKIFIKKEKLFYNSITNIGFNPTVNKSNINKKSIETFIFNFNKDIYNHEVIICFYKLLRYEKKFESIQCLKQQINKDIKSSKIFFKKLNNKEIYNQKNK